MGKRTMKQGVVSIFVVIFSALLLTVLTVSFIQLMMSEQQRSSNRDLSQSAFDAALAGVEDAKRVLRACAMGGETSIACQAVNAAGDCKVIARAGIAGSVTDNEIIIQSSTGAGDQFNQAYTCVNISMLTPDFVYEATGDGQSQLIPLRADGEYNRVVVEWLMQEDIGADSAPAVYPGAPTNLPPAASWGATNPPIMRAQIITPGDTFTINALNDSSTSQTVFLRPSTMTTGATNLNVNVDPAARPRAIDQTLSYDNDAVSHGCSRDFANVGYSCKVTLDLGRTVTSAQSQQAFLRLTPVYRGAHIRVTMLSPSGATVNFDGVQPSVDATGRASSLFRRVEARLQIGEDFPYPNYAVDVANGLCKDFSVDTTSARAGSCTP